MIHRYTQPCYHKAQQAQEPVKSTVAGKCSCGEVLITDPRYTVETDSMIHRYTQPCYHKAQQAQEPVAWMHKERVDVIHKSVKALLDRHETEYLHRPLCKTENYTIPLYTAPQPAPAIKAQQAQEPVAWVAESVLDKQFVNGRPRRVWYECADNVGVAIYTAPQGAEVDQLRAALEKAREAFDSALELIEAVIPLEGDTTRNIRKALAAIDAAMKEKP